MALTKITGNGLATSGLPAGSVLQVKQIVNNTKITKASTSFVDSGLFSGFTFDNNLQANSKVFATIEATIGEQNSASWAYPFVLTLYEGSTNIGTDANSGICGSLAVISGNNGNDIYGMERVYGSILYSPSSTNPSYKLYVKSVSGTFNRAVGGSININTGGTRITLMEIAG